MRKQNKKLPTFDREDYLAIGGAIVALIFLFTVGFPIAEKLADLFYWAFTN
jgi:hypothetical protein